MIFILAMITLSGCGPSAEQLSTQTSTALTAVAAQWTPTSTVTATPAPTATSTVAPAPTIEPTPVEVAGESTSFTVKGKTISLIVPDGWSASSDPDRVILNGPIISGVQTSLSFTLDQYAIGDTPLDADWMGISFFSAHVQDTITAMVQNPVMVSEELLETPGGAPYFRWIMEHKTNRREYHMAFYIFGSEKWFLTIMYGRAKSGGAEMDAMIDEIMKTLKFN